MTFNHVHDAAEFHVFRSRMHAVIEAAGRRHMAELRRAWQTPQHLNRSAAQRARWARQKGQQQ